MMNNEAISLPSVLVIHTASALSFVLYRDKSRTKTMKNDSGIYVSSLTIYSKVPIIIFLQFEDTAIIISPVLAVHSLSVRRQMIMIYNCTYQSWSKKMIPNSVYPLFAVIIADTGR